MLTNRISQQLINSSEMLIFSCYFSFNSCSFLCPLSHIVSRKMVFLKCNIKLIIFLLSEFITTKFWFFFLSDSLKHKCFEQRIKRPPFLFFNIFFLLNLLLKLWLSRVSIINLRSIVNCRLCLISWLSWYSVCSINYSPFQWFCLFLHLLSIFWLFIFRNLNFIR